MHEIIVLKLGEEYVPAPRTWFDEPATFPKATPPS
jgi:hypothetical protein